MRRILILPIVLLVVMQRLARGSDLRKCERDYVKIGCYEENAANSEDLLINDRHNIRWNNIEAYMHHLACSCSEAAKAANEERVEAYIGFALHYYGECYGRTKTQFEALINKDQSHRCIGNQSYTRCEASNKECVGHASAEYIYIFKDSSIENVNGGYGPWAAWTACKGRCGIGRKARERTCTQPEPKGKGKGCSALGPSTERNFCDTGKKCPKLISSEFEKRACEGESMSIVCKGDSTIKVTSATFGRLSLEYCKKWYGDKWKTDCRSPVALSKVKKLCERKSSCYVYANAGIFGEPCQGTEKYLEIKYKCKSRD